MDRDKAEIEKIRNSIHYKVAGLIVGVKKAPVKNGLLFPFHLLKLLRKHRQEKRMARGQEPSLLAPGFDRAYLNMPQYVNIHREVHRASMIRPAQVFPGGAGLELQFGSMVDEELYRCLAPDVTLSPLLNDNWESSLKNNRHQAILVSSAWKLSQGGSLAFATEDHWAVKALARCRTLGIATLFWYTDCAANVDAFNAVCSHVSHIFCSDEASRNALTQRFPDKVRETLPPAIQPVMHNPVHLSRFDRGRLDLLYDGWADLLEYPEELSAELGPLQGKGLHVVDSRNVMIANKLKDLPGWQQYILGNLDYFQLIAAMKCYSLCLFPQYSLDNDVLRAKRIMESLACGAKVLASPEACEAVPADVRDRANGLLVETGADFAGCALQLFSENREELSHITRRYLMQHHTYLDRLEIMCGYIGVDTTIFDRARTPKISVITPTKRPDVLASRLANYFAQVYSDKEWIILVNGTESGVERLQREISGRGDVRLGIVHQQENIGACLNGGLQLATGILWFKMDDDDFYGENYLQDLVHTWRATGAKVFGKPQAFVYGEAEDTLFCRKNRVFANTVVNGPTPYLCGATLSGTVESARIRPFSQTMRGCVDSLFFEDAHEAGELMVFSDPYNFTVFRAAEANFHTWRPEKSKMFDRSKKICRGRGRKLVDI